MIKKMGKWSKRWANDEKDEQRMEKMSREWKRWAENVMDEKRIKRLAENVIIAKEKNNPKMAKFRNGISTHFYFFQSWCLGRIFWTKDDSWASWWDRLASGGRTLHNPRSQNSRSTRQRSPQKHRHDRRLHRTRWSKSLSSKSSHRLFG